MKLPIFQIAPIFKQSIYFMGKLGMPPSPPLMQDFLLGRAGDFQNFSRGKDWNFFDCSGLSWLWIVSSCENACHKYGRNFFKIPVKIGSSCCLKFYWCFFPLSFTVICWHMVLFLIDDIFLITNINLIAVLQFGTCPIPGNNMGN